MLRLRLEPVCNYAATKRTARSGNSSALSPPLSRAVVCPSRGFPPDKEKSMRYGIDLQAGGFLDRYYVILLACVLLAVALLVKRRFRRYPSAKRDKRSDEER